MKKTHITWSILAAFAVATLVSSNALAGPCDGAQAELAKGMKIFKQICAQVEEASGKKNKICNNPKSAEALKVAKRMAGEWNKIAGNARLGPRTYAFGSKQRGTIIAPGQRMWLSRVPSATAKRTVSIEKLGGKSRVKAHVCLVSKNGKSKLVRTIEIPKGTKKFNKSVVVSGAKGKLVTVKLKGITAGRKLQYRLRVK